MPTLMYAPDYLALRKELGLKSWQGVRKGEIEPHPTGWTWNKAKTAPVFVEGVHLSSFFNYNGDKLEAKTGRGNVFPLTEFWATQEEAIDALIAHHEAQVAKLKKQIASASKKIAKLRDAR